MLQGLAALPARQGEAHSLQIEQQLALAALQVRPYIASAACLSSRMQFVTDFL